MHIALFQIDRDNLVEYCINIEDIFFHHLRIFVLDLLTSKNIELGG